MVSFPFDTRLSGGGEANALAVDVALLIAAPIAPNGDGDRCLHRLPSADVSGESSPELRDREMEERLTVNAPGIVPSLETGVVTVEDSAEGVTTVGVIIGVGLELDVDDDAPAPSFSDAAI